VLGEHDWTQIGEALDIKYGVESVTLHPRFREGAQFNFDYAVVKLSRPVDFERVSWIRPACLPEVNDSLTGESGLISGWGLTSWSSRLQAATLQAVNVNIMDLADCVNHYSHREVTDNMICATAPGADSCSGDSGGPLTTQVGDRSVLTGIVSWGVECGRPEYPGVYSRVSRALEWIKRHTENGETCQSSLDRNAPVRFSDNRGERRAG